MMLLCRVTIFLLTIQSNFKTPIDSEDRKSVHTLHLTEIGEFGLQRVARPKVPAHLHTGIDIQRPEPDYDRDQYIFPIADGVVISKRVDGPYAQLIVEHEVNGLFFWTVYEHISSITVDLYEPVNPNQPIARFFNREELDMYGWQFDHFHFEILKKKPLEIIPEEKHPERRYNSYSLSCKDRASLEEHFYDPVQFLSKMINR